MKLKNKVLFTGVLATALFSLTTTVNAQTSAVLPTTVTSKLPDTVVRGEKIYSANGGMSTEGNMSVPFYVESSDGKYYLYCADRANTAAAQDTLTKAERMDYGLVYILKNTYPTKSVTPRDLNYKIKVFDSSASTVTDMNDEDYEFLEIWIAQSAIWGYQKTLDTSKLDNSVFSFFKLGTTTTTHEFYTDGAATVGLNSREIWNKYVSSLISGAQAVKDPAEATLTLAMENKWTEEDNVYKSSLITVSSSNSEAVVNNYQLSLQNAPTGTKVYTESGNEITASLSNIAAGTKVYITVPTSEVKNGSANFTLNAKANIKYDAAYKYVDKVNNHQPSVLVGPETKDIAGSINLTITPDTASMISKSIYFIGFIILLSGAGIIYANVKPREQEAE